jgi:co-chaperonin GroES (HSP10)
MSDDEKDGVPVPLNDWVLISPHTTPDKVGVIEMPDSVKKRINKGNVEAVGPGHPVDGLAMDLFFDKDKGYTRDKSEEEILKAWPRRPMAVKVGDVAHYPDYAGHEVSSEVGAYIMVKEEDIIAVE